MSATTKTEAPTGHKDTGVWADARQLAVLGEAFSVLATKALALRHLLAQIGMRVDTEAAEALACQIGAIADIAADWCGGDVVHGGLDNGEVARWFVPPDLLDLAAPEPAIGQEGGAA